MRKTKQAALATRSIIIDAAERLFLERGVAGSSLQDIAQAAGVTRGAIYWHFEDKGDLFNAMMDRAFLPLEHEAAQLDDPSHPTPPLQRLAAHLAGLFDRFAADEHMRRVFEIAMHKVEYVDELVALRERHRAACARHVDKVQALLQQAMRDGSVPRRRDQGAHDMALGLHAMTDGLLQLWMLDPQAFDISKVGRQTVRTYLAGLTMPGSAPGARAPRRRTAPVSGRNSLD